MLVVEIKLEQTRVIKSLSWSNWICNSILKNSNSSSASCEAFAAYWTVPLPDIVNYGLEKQVFCTADLMGNSASQGAQLHNKEIPPQEASQDGLRFPAITVGM